METEKTNAISPRKRRKKRWWLKLIYTLIILFAITDLFLYFFATPILKSYLQDKVKERTNGLFSVNFENISIELGTRRVVLEDFELIPDTSVYNNLVKTNQTNAALYTISCKSIELWRTGLYSLFFKSSLSAKELKLLDPIVELKKLPKKDSLKTESRDFVHKDLFPAISPYLKEIKIDLINLENGKFHLNLKKDSAKSTTHIGLVSVKLFDFLLNEYEHNNQSLLFFATSLQININDYRAKLSDNIHFVYADKISISSEKSELTANKVGISPINTSKRFLRKLNANYYKIEAPEITFKYFDLYNLYFNNDIRIEDVTIKNPSINLVNIRNRKKVAKNKRNKSLEVDLSRLIKGKLNSITIDTFKIDKGKLAFYYNHWNKSPTYKANAISFKLSKFRLDKYSNNQRNKIFYSDDINLEIDSFTAALPDNVHLFYANHIEISSQNRNAVANGLSLRSIATDKAKTQNRYNIRIPALEISGSNFHQLYHNRIFNISHLSLGRSRFNIHIKKTQPVNKDTKKRTIFDLITSNFLKRLYVRNLSLRESQFKINNFENDSAYSIYKGKAHFELKRLLITASSSVAANKLFFSDEFRLKLKDYSQDLNDRIHVLESKRMEISSMDSLIEITDFTIRPKNEITNKMVFKRNNKVYKFKLLQASIKGIDINKAYIDSTLLANSISVFSPEIIIENHFQAKRIAKTLLFDSIPINQIHKTDSLNAKDSVYDGTFRGFLTAYFKLINVQALNVERANVKVSDVDSLGANDEIMSGKLSAKLNKFYFNAQKDSLNNRTSYSEDISFRVDDYYGKLFGKKYQLKVKQAKFSSKDSSFAATIVRLFPDKVHEQSETANNLWSFYSPKIETKNTKIGELFDYNILDIGSLKIETPILALTRKIVSAQKTLKSTGDSIRKAMGLRKIKFDDIKIENGVFGMLKDTFDLENLTINTKVNLHIQNVEIDTSTFSNPSKFLSGLNAQINLNDIRYQLPDSLHILELDKLEINTAQNTIRGDSLKYYNIGGFSKIKVNADLNNLVIPEFSFSGFEFDQLAFHKTLKSENLSIERPYISIFSLDKKTKKETFKLSKLNLYEKIKKNFVELNLQRIKINDAKLAFSKQKSVNVIRSIYNKISAKITNLLVDSLHQKNEKILNADDISIVMKDYGFNYSNNLYNIHFKEIGISTGNKSAFAKTISLSPNVEREKYADSIKKEINLNYLKSDGLEAKGVDFVKLIDNRQFIINTIDIFNIQFHSYKNKQFPLDSVMKEALPLERIYHAKNLIKVDTIKVHDSYLGYEILGKNARESGIIDFTKINGTITNLTNDKEAKKSNEEISIKASGYLMNKSLLTAIFFFPLDTEYGEYVYGGTLDTFDIREINPLLENLVFISIEDGIVNKLNFNVYTNEDYAEGKLIMDYNNLKIDLISKKKSDTLVVEKRGLFSMVANSIIRDNNPRRKNGTLKEGRIYFERNVYRPIFNYWTFALMSGMKSTLGFKSKQFKERLQIEKYASKKNKKKRRIDKKTTKRYEKQIQKESKDENKNRKKEQRKGRKLKKSENISLISIRKCKYIS